MQRASKLVDKNLSPRSIRLRGVREEDLLIFYEHQRDPVANQMAEFPAREYDAFMTHWHKIMGDETVILKTILFEGRVAGNIVSFLREDTREVGYWIGRELWGKGIATEALRRILRQIKARPLYAGVVKHNRASIRVLEKCGFSVSRAEGQEVILKLG
jgi:RimJ/RimL family protein N-acetyltransferase